MRRQTVLVVTAAVAVLAAGCSSGDPDPDASGQPTSGGVTTSSPDTPSGDPSGDPSATPDERPEWYTWAHRIRISDVVTRAGVIERCFDRQPEAARCVTPVIALPFSARAVSMAYEGYGDPPAEIADLVARTVVVNDAAVELAETYVAECPEAGATSAECLARLEAMATGDDLDELLAVYAEWEPYVEQIDG